jgi:nitrile hydratase beta subunit
MNGVHDMGGMHGFGPVERDDVNFHAEWEKRVYALNAVVRIQRMFNIDEFRHGIERMPPADYLRSTYYERWLATIERNLVEKGILRRDEIDARHAAIAADPAAELPRREDPALAAHVVERQLATGEPPRREGARPRFRAGQAVRTRNVHPAGHTRLPRYARGKAGVIARFHGVDTLPDASAHGRGASPEPLYSVRFEAAELWGPSAEGRQSVYLDLWESYLEGVS